MASENQSNRSRIVNAALTVGVLLLISSLLNLVREQLLAGFYGTKSAEATAFGMIVPLPELIFVIISGGALGSAFIPVFARFFSDSDAPDFDGASYMFSAVVNLVLLAALIVCGVAILFAEPFLGWWYAEKLAERPELLPLIVPMFRIMLVAQIIFTVSGVVMVSLYARQRFLMPALAVVVYALGQIVGVVLLNPNPLGLAWGMVLGALGHLFIQLPTLWREQIQYRPILTLSDPNVRRVLWLMAPRTLGLAFSFLNPVLIPYIAQTMVAGSLQSLRFANRIMLTPQAFIGRALGTASFPTFAEMATRGDHTAMRRIISDILRLILFIGVPLTVIMMVLAQPLIQLVFQRGEFDATDTRLTATALFYYALAFVSLSIIEILARAFYALEDTLTPVLVGAGQLVVMFGLSFWLGRIFYPSIGRLGIGGVALGYSISNWIEVLVLLFVLRRKMYGLNGGRLLAGVWRVGVAGVSMAAVMLGGWRLIGVSAETNLITLALAILSISSLGGLTYLAICYLLNLQEMRQASTAVFARLRKNKPVTS